MRLIVEITGIVMILGLTVLAACRALPPESTTTITPSVTDTTAPSPSQNPPVVTTTTATPVSDVIPTAAATISNPAIVITFRPTFFMQAGLGNVLVVNLVIENKGYDSFNTSPQYFFVNVNNAKYKYYPEGSDLKSTDIPNGGKVIGKLAFLVPSGTASFRADYSMGYAGTRLYNVQWMER